jgi:bla regulator protein BlaR1
MLSEVVFDALVKSSVVLAASLVTVRLLKRRSAALRHAVVWWALAVGALVPLVGRALPERRVPTSLVPSKWQDIESGFSGRVSSAHGFDESPRIEPWCIALLYATWIGGFLLTFSRTLLRQLQLVQLRKAASTVKDGNWCELLARTSGEFGVQRSVTLLRSDSVEVPFTCGLIRPAIVLPEDDSWTDAERRMILCHEFAHIRRRDSLLTLIAESVCAVYWFNPLFLIVRKALRRFQEHACDDAVLLLGERPSAYADLLLSWDEYAPPSHAVPATAIAGSTALGERIIAVLDRHAPRQFGRLPMLILALTSMGLAVPLATTRFVAKQMSHSHPVEPPRTAAAIGEMTDSAQLLQPGRAGHISTPNASPSNFGRRRKMEKLGVTSEYVNDLKSEGYSAIPPGTLMKLKKLGVDREFIRSARSQGDSALSTEDLIMLKKKGHRK